MKVRLVSLDSLAKAGPYIGPRGGKYADPARKIPWNDKPFRPPAKVAACKRCSGLGHTLHEQQTIGGKPDAVAFPCRKCNPRGTFPLNRGEVKRRGQKQPIATDGERHRAKQAVARKESRQRARAHQRAAAAAAAHQRQQPALFKGYPVEVYPLGGYLEMQGLRIAIENPKGSKRRWYDPATQTAGETVMVHPYGYIAGAMGADGDEVDVYVGPNRDSRKVFVINQRKMRDKRAFDEHKVMLGFDSEAAARKAYLVHFDHHGPKMLGSCRTWTMARFKKWLESGKTHEPACKSEIGPTSAHGVNVQHRQRAEGADRFLGGPGSFDGQAAPSARLLTAFASREGAEDFVRSIGRPGLQVVPKDQLPAALQLEMDTSDGFFAVLEKQVTTLVVPKAGE